MRHEVQVEKRKRQRAPVRLQLNRIRVVQVIEALAVEGVDLHPLVAHVEIEVPLPERLRSFEEDLAQDGRTSNEGAGRHVERVDDARRGGDDWQGTPYRLRERSRDRLGSSPSEKRRERLRP